MPRLGAVFACVGAFLMGITLVIGWTLRRDDAEGRVDPHTELRAELEQLRAEVANARRVQRVLPSGTSNLEDWEEPADKIPGDSKSGEQLDGASGLESAPFMEPEDPEAEVARADEQLEVLADALDSEPRDVEWAPSMERALDDSLERYIARFPGGIARESICGKSLCRMEVVYPDQASLQRYSRSFYPPQGLSRGFVRFLSGEDGPKMVAFYAKEGATLPGT